MVRIRLHVILNVEDVHLGSVRGIVQSSSIDEHDVLAIFLSLEKCQCEGENIWIYFTLATAAATGA